MLPSVATKKIRISKRNHCSKKKCYLDVLEASSSGFDGKMGFSLGCRVLSIISGHVAGRIPTSAHNEFGSPNAARLENDIETG